MHRAIQERGFGRTRKEFEDLIFRILADPHGETNIDEFKDETAGQVARLVHEVTGPLAELVPGKRLAIKSTGLDMHHTREYLEAGGSSRTLLTNQFRETLELWRKQQQYAPEGVGGIIFVNEVYGIVSYTDDRGGRQEWMLMEYVPDAKAVTNIELVKIGGGFIPAFSIEQYPELAQLTGIDPRLDADKTHIRFEELQKVIEEALHDWSRKSAIADLNGNNILEQRDENGRVRYTLIDIASHQ